MNNYFTTHTPSYEASKGLSSTLIPALFLSTIIGAISLTLDIYWISAIGVSAFTFYFMLLLLGLGKDIPIESLAMVICSSQWVIGPLLSYKGFSDHFKYYMYVPESDYMELAVPAVILFSLGIYMFRSRDRVASISNYVILVNETINRRRNLPFYLIGVGFLFSFLYDYFPQSLAFPAYVLSNIKYIGLIYLLFSGHFNNKKMIMIIAVVFAFMSSLKSALFHDLILWFVFIGMYASLLYKPSHIKKILFVILGLTVVLVIQVAKDEYRMMIRDTGSSGYLDKFLYSVEERFQEDESLHSENVERIIVRLNQGWIISRIMQSVPTYVPYASGETVVTAIKAALLPRLLYPEKPIAGGKENYEKYTGYKLHNTSMGVSLLGEAYINFGIVGAWIFMFIVGALFSLVIRWLFSLTLWYPTIWFWFPLMLLHFVKAETELLVQLNYLVKSIILVLVFLYLNKYYLKIRL